MNFYAEIKCYLPKGVMASNFAFWIDFGSNFSKNKFGVEKKFLTPLTEKTGKKRQKWLKMGFCSPEMPFNVCVGLQNYIILLENVGFYNKNAK